MAERNTHPSAEAESPSLSCINPMIISDGWNDDTAHNVRCVLDFLADAITLSAERGMTKDMTHGVHVLLSTCAAAVGVCHV